MIAVVPMAGRGSRYADQGYNIPKPLIKIAGQEMIFWALKSIEDLPISSIVFICLKEHEERYGISAKIANYKNYKTHFVFLEDVTEGQLCTVLAAGEFLSGESEVLIIASDTYIAKPLGNNYEQLMATSAGIISVFDLPGDRWSFARTRDGKVIEVAEKVRISKHASTGVYYFSDGDDLILFGEQMIAANERTLGEYYVIPVYQKMIEAGTYTIKIAEAAAMWDMGTPQAKALFEQNIDKV